MGAGERGGKTSGNRKEGWNGATIDSSEVLKNENNKKPKIRRQDNER
jgi:hypothetical protein